MTAFLCGAALVVFVAGCWQMLQWVLGWHRHTYFLHSYDTGPMQGALTGTRQGQWITACLECSRCGKRKLVERGDTRIARLKLASKEEALVWVRSKCSPAPSHMPEQIEEPAQEESQ